MRCYLTRKLHLILYKEWHGMADVLDVFVWHNILWHWAVRIFLVLSVFPFPKGKLSRLSEVVTLIKGSKTGQNQKLSVMLDVNWGVKWVNGNFCTGNNCQWNINSVIEKRKEGFERDQRSHLMWQCLSSSSFWNSSICGCMTPFQIYRCHTPSAKSILALGKVVRSCPFFHSSFSRPLQH